MTLRDMQRCQLPYSVEGGGWGGGGAVLVGIATKFSSLLGVTFYSSSSNSPWQRLYAGTKHYRDTV